MLRVTQLVARILPHSDAIDPVNQFLASLSDLFRHALHNLSESDMVGITIQNRVNQNDKPIGISFRRKDQLAGDAIISLVQKVLQSNSSFNALDKFIMTVHSVKIPVGFGRRIKRRGRPLSVMSHLKTSVVEMKASENCLAHAIIIAIAKVENDIIKHIGKVERYVLYYKSCLIRQVLACPKAEEFPN